MARPHCRLPVAYNRSRPPPPERPPLVPPPVLPPLPMLRLLLLLERKPPELIWRDWYELRAGLTACDVAEEP
jgi:hypothetical protein